MHPMFVSRALAYLGFSGFAAFSIGGTPEPITESPQQEVQQESAQAEQCIDEQAADELVTCSSWDIKDLCCPGYCAAKNGSNWSSADKIFNACVMSLGCKSGHSSGFMSCTCPKK